MKLSFKTCLAAAALLAAGWTAASAADEAKDSLPDAASQLAAGLLSQASSLRGKSVAVGEIAPPQGGPTELSVRCAEALEAALMLPAKGRELKVLDRRNLESLAKEWELDNKGFIEDSTAKQAGKLLGVDVLLLGKYAFPEKKLIELRASLVDTESGQILAAATSLVKADKRLRAASEKLAPEPAAKAAPRPGKAEPLKVEVWTDKTEYKPGEKFRVSVKANQDCHLTLIDVGTSGSVSVIFPNHQAPDNAVKAGVTYTIPDPAAGFEFEVSGPAGRELVRAIASHEPAVDLADAVGKTTAESPFAELKDEAPALTRDIHVKAKKAKPGEWSEAVLQLKIR
ncbi:MAG: DUF4384 domain-containing protein [Elusimicrobia bacterium]|nr:DUF4384 domain-containing protein [Elusimicrobiota bacterium]